MIYLEVLRDHLTREMKGSWFSYLPHSHWIARQEIREGYCMDEDRSAIARMRAITISREYGSGGGEIGARLAKRLGWQLIDHDVVVRVARLLHVSEKEAEEHDERVESLASRIFRSLRVVHPSDPHLYDLVLNTGILDLESAVEVIALVLERKALRLSLPAWELGPAVGLPRYPGQPEDFRPPQ